MTRVDAIPIAVILLGAVFGARQGGVRTVVPFVGVAVGVLAFGRAAPSVIDALRDSPWLPWATLGFAGLCLGIALWLGDRIATALGGPLSRGVARRADQGVGIAAGSLLGIAVVWLGAAVLVQRNAASRDSIRRSATAAALLDALPPARVLGELERFGSMPVISDLIPQAPLPPPDPRAIATPALRRAAQSVVKIHGDACGWGIEGSGWVVARERVVTNVHVVTGQTRPTVIAPDGRTRRARIVAIDVRNDLALLAVPGLESPPLELAATRQTGEQVAILGFPEDGGLKIARGTLGAPTTPSTQDAYGRPATRTIVPLRVRVRHGNSGGPVIDAHAQVTAVVFASDLDGRVGYAVPLTPVRDLLTATGRVRRGPCPTR